MQWDNGLDELGFVPVTRMFLQKYRVLNVSMEEAMLIIHLLDTAWGGKVAFPGASYFSEITGKAENTIRVYFRSLCQKGYLIEVVLDGQRTYDWSPLLKALKGLVGLPNPDTLALDATVEKSVEPEPTTSLGAMLREAASLAPEKKPKKRRAPRGPAKKSQDFSEKSPESYNVNDIEQVLASAWQSKGWRTPPGSFTMRDKGNAKRLIETYGPAVVADVITKAISQWESLCPKLRLSGAYPSIGLIYGYRNSIFPLMIDGDNSAKPSWGSHFDREKDSAPTGKTIGW